MALRAYLETNLPGLCDTPDGARWLASYIDPAHGDCQTVPDEDNTPSLCLRSNFNFTIDRDFFVSPDYTGDVPDNLDFSVYLTPFPDFPVMVVGFFFFMSAGSPVRKQKACLMPDANVTAFVNGGNNVTEIRCMYKGCTMHYTGNQYNNEGSLTAASVVIPSEDVANATTGDSDSIGKLWRTSMLPVGPDNISNASQLFSNYSLPGGIYMVQQYTGTRSLYACADKCTLEDINGYGGAKILPQQRCSYLNRFKTEQDNTAILWSCNLNWVCCAVDSMNSAQSLLFRVYAGWQCHYSYESGYSILETHKSFLDPRAIALASQINAGVPSVYPAAYNDFRKVWSRVYSFLGSKAMKKAVNAVGELGGGFATVSSIYNALFFSVCNKHNNGPMGNSAVD